MDWMTIFAGTLSFALLIYLTVALVVPEKFS